MNIKGFDKNLCCRGFQFEVGKEYKIELNGRKMQLCSDTVFHYCKSLIAVHEFYNVRANNRYCEIEVLGEEITDGTKCGSNHIKIVREITGDELQALIDPSSSSTGLFNTGSYNTGSYNTGFHNTGFHNTGFYNTGSYNTGDYNTGFRNTGSYNTGFRNTGSYNTGFRNTGSYNTGDWNSCNYSSGFFCTEEPKARLFNIDTDMTVSEFRRSKYYRALISVPFMLTAWIDYTDNKKDTEEKKIIGGYLKKYTYEEACANWWNEMTEENKEIIKSMPNFDANIFKEITGIDINKG